MQETAVIQVAFPASVDLLVRRGHSAVPSPFSVSFNSVIFTVVYWLCMCVCVDRESECICFFYHCKMQHKAFFVFCDIHLHYLNYYAFIIILLQSYSRLELVLLAVSF